MTPTSNFLWVSLASSLACIVISIGIFVINQMPYGEIYRCHTLAPCSLKGKQEITLLSLLAGIAVAVIIVLSKR